MINPLFKVYSGIETEESIRVLSAVNGLFQKQLPKMPKEYITRTVYSPEHNSIVLFENTTQKIIGGITYRHFEERSFCEIVFCAIDTSKQIKGNGALIMNLLKEFIKTKALKRKMYFLTYADNNAIGYFKKQGFSVFITLKKEIWVGYIKDYDGGTLMQCRLLWDINYMEKGAIFELWRNRIMSEIQKYKDCLPVYKGIGYSGMISFFEKDPLLIPGVKEAGWSAEMEKEPFGEQEYKTIKKKLLLLKEHNSSWPFLVPVNKEDVPGYFDVIKEPMDLQKIETKLEEGNYTIDAFTKDVELMIKNCKKYNSKTTSYYKCAIILFDFFKKIIKQP